MPQDDDPRDRFYIGESRQRSEPRAEWGGRPREESRPRRARAEAIGDSSPSVTVFGAGITGLAAAHELIERGFLVQVLEPKMSPDGYGDVEVGGMAASQYSHIPLPRVSPNKAMQRTRSLYPTPEKIYFEPDADAYDPDFTLPQEHIANAWKEPLNREKLEAVSAQLAGAWAEYGNAGEKLSVEVIGHTDDSKPGQLARDLAARRAEAVHAALGKALLARRVDPSSIEFKMRALGSAEPFGDNAHVAGRARNNRVEFEIEEMRLPGEHGYRFYPAFYHNLDDLLRRIPIYDEQGHPTHRRVLDNLEPAPLSRFAAWDRAEPIRFPRKRPRSIEEFRKIAMDLYKRLEFPPNDITLFEAKLFRFLTTSHERRLAEYSNESWWDFVEGKRYSEVVQRHMRAAPQALVAMSVKDTDAHTAGNIYLQLMLDQLRDGSRTDRTMNGPTSEAWLRHWKCYLDRQGVKFYRGYLEGVTVGDGRSLVPKVKWPRDAPCPEPIYTDEGLPVSKDIQWMPETNYYVLAVPALAAKKVLSGLDGANLDTTLRQVVNYDVTDERDADGRLKGPLRDFVGIQFYFDHDFKFARGYTYYPDSDWGLSSISQLQFWQRRRTRDSGYLGILSVDIGDMQEVDSSEARWWATLAFDAMQKARDEAHSLVAGDAPETHVELAKAAAEAAERASRAVDEARKVRYREGIRNDAFERALADAEAAAAAFGDDPTQADALIAAAKRVESCGVGLDPDGRAVAAAVVQSALAARAAAQALEHRKLEKVGRRTADTALYGVKAGASVVRGKTAWHSTPEEIAETVWREIKLGLDPTLSQNIPDPTWYHIDDGIDFSGPGGTCGRNEYAFQINRKGEFEKRPGRMPGREFYEVCNEGWVVAGMYTKTFTRLATMELATESARHAVNAILHDSITPLRGDLCEIFNPEQDEVDDLALLKRVDARLLEENLPHFMDILGWEQAIEVLTRSAHPMVDLGKLLVSGVNTVRRDWNLKELTPAEIRDRTLRLVDGAARAARYLLGGRGK